MNLTGPRSERWGPWMAGAALVFAFIVLSGAGVWSVRQQKYVNHELCAQTVENRAALRTAFIAAQRLATDDLPDGPAKDRTNSFFTGILLTIPQLECSDNKPVTR